MIYILDQGGEVRLGGQVADDLMLAEGWQPYEGEIPQGERFRLVDGVLVAVPVKPLAQAKAERLAANNAAYDAAVNAITAAYPQNEKDTWPTQNNEARAWQANPDAPTPWIDIAAQMRGIDRVDYLQRTLAKALQFEQASAYLTGIRQRIEDRIKAATTVEDVEAIAIDYSMPEAMRAAAKEI